MKIEKINDSQIRCILTKSELEKRDLKLSEIAYGSAKVKKLFRDMMQLAYVQCGFEADNIPLAIEVIPFRDYASIIVTKVEEPEELDTRYSRFAPGVDASGGILSELDRLFRNITSSAPLPDGELPELPFDIDDEDDESPAGNDSMISIGNIPFKEAANRYFYFDGLDDLFTLAGALDSSLQFKSTLYKDKESSDEAPYVLEISKEGLPSDEFTSLCAFVSEYGSLASTVETFPYYLTEHYEILIKDDALTVLKSI
ncbi:MAG: adaptor protein MecA [Lachnospiraceae bacterium]|nr:adaptor protein MecA [Lachnospiraceae bacterium]